MRAAGTGASWTEGSTQAKAKAKLKAKEESKAGEAAERVKARLTAARFLREPVMHNSPGHPAPAELFEQDFVSYLEMDLILNTPRTLYC